MMGGSNPHPLRQVAPSWVVDYGQTQLRPPGLEKGKLLSQGLALSLGIFPPMVDIG
jgi:hypothetical protein